MDFLRFLPEDIIFKHIIIGLDFTSRVRAASVSRIWNDLFRVAPCIPYLPWLWFTEHTLTGNDDYESAPIYNSFLVDLASSTTTPSCNPSAPSHRFKGSRGPYLTFSNLVECKLTSSFIYSPFTGKNIHLPLTYLDRDGESSRMAPGNDIQFSSKPPNCVVAAWNYKSRAVYLSQPGDDNWVEWLTPSHRLGDMIFHKGQLYCVEGTDIMAYNIMQIDNYEKKRCDSSCPNVQSSSRKIAAGTHVIKSFYPTNGFDPGYHRSFLVESGEELLVVVRSSTFTTGKVAFTVHRVDEEKGELVQVDDLGGRMLFVEDGCSVMSGLGPGPTIRTDNFFTKNSIYFFYFVKGQCEPGLGSHRYRLGKFQLDSNTCHYHPLYRFQWKPFWVVSPNQNK